MSEHLKIAACVIGIIIIGFLVHSYNKTHESFQNNIPNNTQEELYQYTPAPSTMAQESPNNLNQETGNYGGNVATPDNFIQEGKDIVQPSFGSNPDSNEVYASINAGGPDSPFGLHENQVPSDCYPKDQLTPKDLLPQDPNSKWAQVNPAGQGELKDQNFLNAGYHVGINTVGQTMRNANLQLRSEPPNPQVKVSPWQQSTIEPDTNRRPMEIGGCE